MHVTDIKKFLRCPCLLKNAQQEKNADYFSFFNISIDTNASIAKKLNITDYSVGAVNQTSADTLIQSIDTPWIFKARFEYNDLRVKIPLIHIEDENCDLYFLSILTNVNEDEGLNILFSKYVVEHSGLNVRNIRCFYLNKDYAFDQKLDDKQLWLITDSFMKDGRKGRSFEEYLSKSNIDVEATIEAIKNLGEVTPVKTNRCSGKNRCQYFEKCFPESTDYEDNSILTLASSQYKYQMYQSGIKYLKDADPNLVEGNAIQFAQIQADKNNGLFFDRFALKTWMKKLKFPISFIDFEWDLYPIPPYQGMKPLNVLMFQYSLHVFDGKNLKHYEYIGEKDDRFALMKSMLENLPEKGSVVAYNALGAEKIRIEELAQYYPDYKDQLEAINKRMEDMAIPFINGIVYDVRMRGSFNLKTIEEMIDKEHSYHNLDVSNGIEAVDIHRRMENAEGEEKEKYYQQLYQYCGLDSYSLYKVYNWLNEILNH